MSINENTERRIQMGKSNEDRKEQIDEMTSIWAAGNEYGKGYLNGIIDAVVRLASRNDEKRPAV